MNHPHPRAFEDPKVVEAFGALNNLCGDNMFFTNYADQRWIYAMKDVMEGTGTVKDKLARMRALVVAYEAFLDALEPHQPSAALVQASSEELASSIADSTNDTYKAFQQSLPDPAREAESGKMFYFVEGSGGYWIEGRPFAAKARGALFPPDAQSEQPTVDS